LGLHFVPEERLGRGAVPTLSLAHNLLLTRTESITLPRFAGGWIRTRALRSSRPGMIAALQGQSQWAARRGAFAVGRQFAKVHCRA
jgi:ABC-type uncharacterized transport system ATPase subunit